MGAEDLKHHGKTVMMADMRVSSDWDTLEH